MSAKPKVLDLFCGGGGMSAGYASEGFDVTGVDLYPMPEYPFRFEQSDWRRYLDANWRRFDFIRAAPVCKGYANVNTRTESTHAREIPEVRDALVSTGKPFEIENVASARWDMREPVQLCGSAFRLRVRRHRLFEASFALEGTPCAHAWQNADKIYLRRGRYSKPTRSGVCPVNGDGKQLLGVTAEQELELRREAMGISWMSWGPLTQAVPPAYGAHVARQARQVLL